MRPSWHSDTRMRPACRQARRLVRKGEDALPTTSTKSHARARVSPCLCMQRVALKGEEVALLTSTAPNTGTRRYPHRCTTAQERNAASCTRARKHPPPRLPRARIGPMQPLVRLTTPMSKRRTGIALSALPSPPSCLGVATLYCCTSRGTGTSYCSRTSCITSPCPTSRSLVSPWLCGFIRRN